MDAVLELDQVLSAVAERSRHWQLGNSSHTMLAAKMISSSLAQHGRASCGM